MAIEDELKDSGFTNGEIKVYIALIHLGASTVGAIIKKSQISSSKVYVILNKLIAKGLVSSVTRNKTKVFKVQEPYRLLDFIETQEKELKERKKRMNAIIPELIQIMKEKREATIEVLEGKRGFMSIHEKELSRMGKGDVYYTISNYTFGKEYAGFWIRFNETRGNKGIKSYILYSYENWNQPHRMEIRKERKLFYPRLLPKHIKIPTHLSIFKDSVILSLFEEEILSIVIRSKAFLLYQRQYFDVLWERADKVQFKTSSSSKN